MIFSVLCLFSLISTVLGRGKHDPLHEKRSKLAARLSSANRDAFDCPMRQLLLEYAVEIQPDITSDRLQEMADALNGTPEKASNCTVVPDSSMLARPTRHAPSWNDLIEYENIDYNNENDTPFNEELNQVTLFVCNEYGDDSNIGTITSPLRTLEIAVEKAKNYPKNVYKRIILRKGKYYLKKTITFDEKDSNFLISNFNNEQVILSGATPLSCDWKFYANGTNGNNIYSCDLSAANVESIMGLRIDGVRAIRARYPNANPETDGFGSTLTAISWNEPTLPAGPAYNYNPTDYPVRNDSSAGYFFYYTLGIDGCCENFSPPAGYWCSTTTQGGGAFTYIIPSGMKFNSSVLPNSPYNDASDAVIQSWRPAHWASWMFAVGEYNKDTLSSQEFIFSKGGFQGARGDSSGEDFYIENVLEEVDYPTEWFYNRTTKMLYYYNNDTSGSAPSNVEFEATNLKVLLSYNGSMANPVSNHMVRGMTFSDSQYTYLDPHGMPSGGDWALQRTGAVYLNGVQNITLDSNNFTRLDGNALSINRFARNVSVTNNEFSWIGDSAITQWGDTEGLSFLDENGTRTSMGYDGTSGNQPRGTYIAYNYVRELGIWEKQSSFYFQAKSCQNTIEHNIFFNGPRAGVNYNDGFGGGSKLTRNILFNTCRESSDHGNFNSWDRQVYVTKVVDGTPSTLKLYDEISYNFMIGNYDVTQVVDNDDGSMYYKTFGNFMAYSTNGEKSDFGGHDNHHYNNIYAYLTQASCFAVTEGSNTWQYPANLDYYYNNTCVVDATVKKLTTYGTFDCDKPQNTWPILGNNTVYIANGSSSNVGLCGKSEDSFQSTYGVDMGTTISSTYPSASDLIAQTRQLLFS